MIGLIHFETVTVPKWRVKVVDSNEVPMPKIELVESCENYTLSVDPCLDAPDRLLTTDKNGIVAFSERRVRMNLWLRVFNSVINFLLILTHGSYGTDAYVLASGSNAELRFDPNKPQPQILKLPAVGSPKE
mgnify:FL=1